MTPMPSRIHRNPSFQPFALGFILDDDAYRELQNVLIEDPGRGDVIKGGGGIRKLRHALLGRGKSLFDDLVQSLKEAKAIAKGEMRSKKGVSDVFRIGAQSG